MIGAALQKAIRDALQALPALAAGQVFDNPPPAASYPYITFGNEQVIDDGTTCGEAWEVFADVHVWSQPVTGSKAEVKNLGAQIAQRLAQPLAVAGFAVISASLETMRTLRDPDGQTEHAILTFRYLLDPME